VARFDMFYVENRETVSTSNTTATTSVTATLEGYGTTFTISSAPTPHFSAGQPVTISGGGKTAYCTVSYASGTSVRLIPIQSTLDSSGVIGNSFASGATISSTATTPQKAATLVVDLTDAPFASATYLIVGTGNITVDTSSSVVAAALRVDQRLDDPFSGTGGYGECVGTFSSAVAEFLPFQSAVTVTLSGGQRYEFSIDFWTTTANNTVTFDEARLVAIRYTTINGAGTGKTAETTTTSTSLQTHLSLTSNLAAGDYLVVSTWVAGISNLSHNVVVQLENSGTALSTSRFVPNATGDYLSGGFMGFVTLTGTNAIALKYRTTNAAGTAKIKNSYLAAIRLPAGFLDGEGKTATDAETTTVNNAFTTLVTITPTSASFPAGRYLQILSVSIGGDSTRFRFRMTTAGDVATDFLGGFRAGTTTDNALAMISLAREDLASGNSANGVLIEGRSANAGGSTFRIKTPRVSWIRERADVVPLYDTPITIVADLEMGGQILKKWNPATTDRYWKHLEDYDLISRVIVNGVEFAEHTDTETQSDLRTSASSSVLTTSEWYWDASNHDLYVQMGSGDSPADVDQNVVVVPLTLVGRRAVDLKDTAGTYYPYEARISGTPGVDEDLKSSNGRFESSRSIGSIDLATADGEYDDMIVRHSMESYRVTLRRGWASLSDRLDDFDVYANAVTGLPSSDFETLRIKLFDRYILLSKPVSEGATSSITVYEGSTPREDQVVPVVYGSVKRLVAYRTTNNTGGTDYNTYVFASHGVSSVTAAYVDGSNVTAIASGSRDFTSTYTNAGSIRVKNDAFDTPTSPQDTVYVDLVGKTSDKTSAGTIYQTPGVIIRDVLLSYGGLATTDIDEAAFRLLDRRWRSQLTASGFTAQAPSFGAVILDEPVESVISRLAGDCFAYICTTPYGRISVRVPDLDAGNLIENGGLESASGSDIWPWVARSGATATAATSRKYDGSKSLEISNGGTPNASANVSQEVILPRSGTYVLTCLASLNSGNRSAFKLGFTRPNGTTSISDAVTITTDEWTRASVFVTLEPGECGTCMVRLYPAEGSTEATTVSVDNIELYEVAAVATDRNSNPTGVEFSDEHYYEAAVTYNVNLEEEQYASKVVITDSEARLIGTTTPEGRYAIESSKRAEIGTTLYKDSSSAAGVAAALANYFSRMRHILSLDVMGLTKIPTIGDYVYTYDNPRVPELSNGYPIWRIVRVSYNPDTAQAVTIDCERQSDPVDDRHTISPDTIPLGAILLSTTAIGTAITDYSEVSGLSGKFLVGATVPDTTSSLGSTTHTHTFSHTHAIPAHTHTWSLSSHTQVPAAASSTLASHVTHNAPAAPAIFGPASTFDAAAGSAGHAHNLQAGTATSASGSGTSGTPSDSTSLVGGNEPAFIRVRFMQRTGDTASTISQNLIVGYPSATLPAGWQRCDGTGGRPNLDGYYVRGWTANTAVSTTVATSTYAPSSSGSTMKVASASNVSVGKRLTVTSGSNSMAVVVTAVSGTDLTVLPLYEEGDDVVSYAVGSTVAGASEAPNTTFSPSRHNHSGALKSHTHSGGSHTHAASGTRSLQTVTSSPVSVVVYSPGTTPGVSNQVPGDHTHAIQPAIPASSDTSSAAVGTIDLATAPLPDTYEIVWMRPSSGSETVLPAGTLILWAQSSSPPAGYEVVGEAVGKLLRGALASAGPVGRTGGHTHSYSADQHTFSHAHGGSATVRSLTDDPFTTGYPYWGNSATTVSAAASNDNPARVLGHGHDAAITITSQSVTMTAASSLTSSADSTMPPHAKVLVLRKL